MWRDLLSEFYHPNDKFSQANYSEISTAQGRL